MTKTTLLPVQQIIRLECEVHGNTLEPGGQRICLACGALPGEGGHLHIVRRYVPYEKQGADR